MPGARDAAPGVSKAAVVVVTVVCGLGVLGVMGLALLLQVQTAGSVHNLVFGGPEPGDADVVAAERSVRPLNQQTLRAVTGSLTAAGSPFASVVATRELDCRP